MAKKKTLDDKIDALTGIVEKGFGASDKKVAAIADDIADIRDHMATKDDIADLRTELKGDIAALHAQANSIESQLRETRIETRLTDLEEKVFGEARR